MKSSQSDGKDGSFFDAPVQPAILGIACIVIGLALFYSLIIGSMEMFLAVLLAILGLVVISLVIVFRREGIITPENKLIAIFVFVSMALLFGLSEFTNLPEVVVFGVVIVVGVLVPHYLLNQGDGRNA